MTLERFCTSCQRSRYMYQLTKTDPETSLRWHIIQCGKCGFNVDLEQIIPTPEIEAPKEIPNESRLEQIKKTWF